MATETGGNFVSKEALKKFYDEKIVRMKLGSGSSGETEIVDIVSEYPWTANNLNGGSSNGSISFQHSVPYCYVIERKQTVNSNIANFINTIKIGIDSAFDTAASVNSALKVHGTGKQPDASSVDNNIDTTLSQGTTQQEGDSVPAGKDTGNAEKESSLGERLSSGASSILNTIGSIKDQYQMYVDNFLDGVASDQLSSNMLSPYRYLYYTQETGKRFIFPMITPTDLLNINNTFSNDTKNFDLGGIRDFIEKGAEMIIGGQTFLNFFDQVSSKGGGKNSNVGMEEYYNEMAKSFQFEPTGQELTINFPLFNTTKKGQWQKNYRFILAFVLRNLPFKVSAYSYKPPLLYDIIVPGTTHLPLCYVSSIQVQHYGYIRMIKTDNFLKTIVDNTELSGMNESTSIGVDGKTNTKTDTNNAREGGTTNTSNSSVESQDPNKDFASGDYKPVQMQVPVPEVWSLTIKFKCLLSNSSNLMLDLANSPINISVMDGQYLSAGNENITTY